MTKELLEKLEILSSHNKPGVMMTVIKQFFSQNLCIPKGANPHPYADVLHEWAENCMEDLQAYNDMKPNFTLSMLDEYHIKPQEPVDNKNTDDIELKENNFEDYGFLDPVFNGHIVGKVSDTYLIGYYVEHYNIFTFPQKIPCFWNIQTGNCYKGGGVSNSKYSLTLKPSEPVFEWQWMLWSDRSKTYCRGVTNNYYINKEECYKSVFNGYYIDPLEETKRERK